MMLRGHKNFLNIEHMGLDIHSVRFLLRARRPGVPFGNVLTVGRLKLDVFPEDLKPLSSHSLRNRRFFTPAGKE